MFLSEDCFVDWMVFFSSSRVGGFVAVGFFLSFFEWRIHYYSGKKRFLLSQCREAKYAWQTTQQNYTAVDTVATRNTLQLFPKSYCFYFLNPDVTDRITKTYMVTFSNGSLLCNLLSIVGLLLRYFCHTLYNPSVVWIT